MLHTVLAARLAAFRDSADALWPAGTTFRPGDVLVEGMSLTRRAQDEGAPIVCVAPAATRCADPLHEPALRTVVLARVASVAGGSGGSGGLGVPRGFSGPGGRRRRLWLDADLDACTPVLRATLLLGRVSRTPFRAWEVHPLRPGDHAEAFLPTDLGPGDLLAIPCLGLVTPREIAP